MLNNSTGYPSIDKPWEKYYSQEALRAEVPHTSLYRALVAENSDNLDRTALVLGCRDDQELTYEEFIDLIDAVARSLSAKGVAAGTQIAATFKNAVEGIALVFAKSRLGAFSHLIDPTNNPNEINRMLCEADAKLLFIAREFAEGLASHLDGTGIETIVVMPSDEGNSSIPYADYGAVEVLSWADFLALGKSFSLGSPHEPAQNEGSIVVYTGGSTGRSKGVILSDYSFVAKYYRCMRSRWKWGRNRKALCVLPATIAFGLSEGFVSTLLAGEVNIIVDCYAMPRFAEFVLGYQPNDISCSPVHMQYLVNSPLIDVDTDLSFLEMFPCGGDGMTLDADNSVRKFLSDHGAADSFAQGCGFTETAGAFCFGQAERNKPGGMGIPLAGNTCGVFDPETGEELPYGVAGEWAVLTDTAMLGYFGSAADKTEIALRRHSDGLMWLHPGDIVHMDGDGVIFMHDRVSRTFNLNGLKVYPSALESIMGSHDAVAKCVVSGVRLGDGGGVKIIDQKVPIANIALVPGNEGSEAEIAAELVALLSQEAQTYIRMAGFVFRPQLPFTSRGKIDYQLLEQQALEDGDDRIVIRCGE